MIPKARLAKLFATLARQHGGKLMHANNIELLTRDLGKALSHQKSIVTDPHRDTLETAYDALPVIIEVKLLVSAVAKKLEIDSKGKPVIAVLQEIVTKTEERQSKAASEIKTTLDWTREFFANPEVQEILKADFTAVQGPKSIFDVKGAAVAALQSGQRLIEEIGRLKDVLEKAKETPEHRAARLSQENQSPLPPTPAP